MSARPGELTIDELAARVGMTVRNVRAYATRGLIAAPRLVGRKGYYDDGHVARLALVRDLLDRGYTLNAVEKALSENPQVPESHALDLLTMLTRPIGGPIEPEQITVNALAELAGIEHDPEFVETLVSRGLLQRVDERTVLLTRPALVRAGAHAMRIGLGKDKVLVLFDEAENQLRAMASNYVEAFRDDVWRPYLSEGMTEEKWGELVTGIESLLSIVSQAVLASFRYELARVIDRVVDEELGALTGEQAERIFGDEGPPRPKGMRAGRRWVAQDSAHVDDDRRRDRGDPLAATGEAETVRGRRRDRDRRAPPRRSVVALPQHAAPRVVVGCR